MSKLETNQVDPATGTTLTLGTSGDTIAIPSGVTIANSGTATGFGESNTPAFMAKPDGNITISDDTTTKLLFATEDFDTDGNYSSSRFTPTTAGKYQVSGAVQWNTDTNYNAVLQGRLFVYKNGGQIFRNDMDPRVGSGQMPISFFNYINVAVDMNGSSDYLELYGYVDVHNSGIPNFWQTNSYFTAFRITT
jgi:hypothetical protein